jgi:hypothetical protein
MTIDRRHLLGSLAAAAVCPPFASAHAAGPTIPARVNHKGRQSPEGWFLVRECRQQPIDHVVDFWERPFGDIAYTEHLSPEIARGAMWYDAFDQPDCQTSEAIGWSFTHQRFDRVEKPLQCASCSNGIDSVSWALRWLIKNDASNSTARTAFLSLDSLSPSPMREPSWADVLPSFRSCYDHIIGHFHLPQRGLRQSRKFLNGHFHSQNGGGYFQEFFTDAAAQCDAVILTSSALVESDFRCCPRASTEELVGKLMRHLGCALLTPAVLERIVGTGEQGTLRKPRFFALSSLVLQTMDDYYLNCDLMIGRQSDLVRGSFGDAIPDERFLLVATAVEDIHSDLVDEVRKAADGSFFITTTPAYEVEKRGYPILNLLKMITFWPFEFDENKLRST